MTHTIVRTGRPQATPRPSRVLATATIAALVVAGLTSVVQTQASPASAAAPDGSDTYLVSRTNSGASTQPFLTPDGQHVAFTSTAVDLAPGGSETVTDVFLSTAIQGSDDPYSGSAELISRPDRSQPQDPANGASSQPVSSADGRYVAFTSVATNLVAGGSAPGVSQVYVRDTVLGTTLRLQNAQAPNGASTSPDMSDDGRYIVFSSAATNLSAGDANGSLDVMIADTDADGDGVRGDVRVDRLLPGQSIPGGTTGGVISGNGDRIAFTSAVSGLGTETPAAPAGTYLYRINRDGTKLQLVMATAHDPAIDATGDAIAYLVDAPPCGGSPLGISTFDYNGVWSAGIGGADIDQSVGFNGAPSISADGSLVAWPTTQPRGGQTNGGQEPVAYGTPMIRVQAPSWWNTHQPMGCNTNLDNAWYDLVPGASASLSASGRTIALSGSASAAPDAQSSVMAIDTHSNSGISVSTIQGQLIQAGFMTQVPIANIPISSLRGYAAALAGSPIHHLPIHHLPIHHLPIHHLPIHHLPIHHLPLNTLTVPGGWPQVLADTPFSGVPEQNVVLADVLDWADAQLVAGSGATVAQVAAAHRIQNLTLDDVDIEDTGIDALSLASFVLGDAPLATVPLPSGSGIAAWQAAASAQGLTVEVDGSTVLADLDYAGFAVAQSGIDSVPLRNLPVGQTLMSDLPLNSLFLAGTPLGNLDVTDIDATTRSQIFTGDVTGTLAANQGSLATTATVADLAKGVPASVSFGTLMFSLLDENSYPWEQIDPTSIDPHAATTESPGEGCTTWIRCERKAAFRFTFDAGPGQTTQFAAPTATVALPPTTTSTQIFAAGSGPALSWTADQPYSGPVQRQGSLVTYPLAAAASGTVIDIATWYSATAIPGNAHAQATLTTGMLSATTSMDSTAAGLNLFQDPAHSMTDGVFDRTPVTLQPGNLYYGWITPLYIPGSPAIPPAPAAGEDFYLVAPPSPGQHLVISTNAADGQIALALYGTQGSATPLGADLAGAAPGAAVSSQGGGTAGAPATAGADAGAALPGRSLIDQSVVGGDGTAAVQAASTAVAGTESLLVRVSSGNGQPSSSLYSLRVQYLDDAVETACPAFTPTGDGVAVPSDPITATTNTVYLFDQKRYGDRYGAAAAQQVRDALAAMNGTGHVGDGTIDGAVLDVGTDSGVATARTAADANPCSMAARRALTASINGVVTTALTGQREHISSIVIVGGDDIIPLAPVSQNTPDFTESGNAASLRLPLAPGGAPCPTLLAAGQLDPCATPLSAAAGGDFILTDDPYGLADAYQTLGGYLYVPTVGLGRLIETPDQILATIGRFVAANGVVAADSTLTGGYGAWSELPGVISKNLAWRNPVDKGFADQSSWTADDLNAALFPVAGTTGAIVSINTHADETRMLPDVPGADQGDFTDAQLYTATSAMTNSPALRNSLVFTIGCHEGDNLPSAYYGSDATDWVDVFSAAAGFVGNTGYGLANNLSTSLSERLLALYSDWLGVTADDGSPVSASGALTYAKQAYLGGLGLYSGYDEKVMMQAVYYGLPMYTLSPTSPAKAAPVVGKTPTLIPAVKDGLLSASLTLSPAFVPVTGKNASGQDVSYLTADGQDPLVVPGQPVLPRLITRLGTAPEGQVARGALITSLTSQSADDTHPAIADITAGAPEPVQSRSGVAFPSTFAAVTTQQTPNGTQDLLVVTPARVAASTDGGTTEKFTDIGVDVIYGPADATDTTAPLITAVQANPGSAFSVQVDGTGSTVRKVLLLAQPEGQTTWQPVPLTNAAGTWSGTPSFSGGYRWIVQAADAAGNVATDSARGRVATVVAASAAPPILGDPGGDVTTATGQPVQRSITVTGVTTADHPTATYTITSAAGALSGSGQATVSTGADGVTRAIMSASAPAPGSYGVTVKVCNATACSTVSFALTVPTANTAPSATVTVASDQGQVLPTSTLTATAVGADADGDPVALRFVWTRNGNILPTTGPVLPLANMVLPGDTIAVTVTPNDGRTDGNAATAQVVVAQPASPVITAQARNADGAYTGGWSRSAVTVTFTCQSPVAVVLCPDPEVVTDDTVSAGVTIAGTMRDSLGRTATASIVIRLDATAPVLSPSVQPDPVARGASAVATAHATDLGSGVASESCDTPATTMAGPATVQCRATDVAGNSTTADARYTVASVTCRGGDDRTALQPVNPDGSSVFLRLSAVPLIFRACDGSGRPIGTKGFVTAVTQISAVALPKSAKVTELLYLLPSVKPVYVKLTGTWAGAVGSASLAGGKKYTYRVSMSDGTSFTFTFGVR